MRTGKGTTGRGRTGRILPELKEDHEYRAGSQDNGWEGKVGGAEQGKEGQGRVGVQRGELRKEEDRAGQG